MEGRCYYTTSGHGISDSYYKSVAAPSSLTSWNTVEFDMAALTAGGSDWSSSTITAIRLIPSMFPAMCGKSIGRGRIALCRSGVKQLRGGRDFRLYQRKRTHWPEGNLPRSRSRRAISSAARSWRRSRCRRIDNDRHGCSIKHLLDCAARRAGRHKDGAVRPLHHTDNDQRRG